MQPSLRPGSWTMRAGAVAANAVLVALAIALSPWGDSRAASAESVPSPSPTTSAFAPCAARATEIAAGTRLHLRLMETISSNDSRTGAPFGFELLEPIATPDGPVPVAGTVGDGTIVLAGHAGNAGHEGDVTLRIDDLHSADGRDVRFDDQRFEINGRNRKVVTALAGFVPFAGYGAGFIRGSEITIVPATPIETVLRRAAVVCSGETATATAGVAATAPAATPMPSMTPVLEPSPAASGKGPVGPQRQ